MQLRQKIQKAGSLFFSLHRHGYNLLSLLASVRDAPPATAFIDDGVQRVSYHDVYRYSLQMAYILEQEYQVKQGQRVLLACPNGIPFLVSLFALSALGCELVLAHPGLKAEGLQQNKGILHIICMSDIAVPEGMQLIHPERLLKNLSAADPLWKVGRRHSYLTIMSSGTQGRQQSYKRAAKPLRFYPPFRQLYRQLNLASYENTYIAIPFFHGYGLAAVLLSLFLEKGIYCHPAYHTEQLIETAKKEAIACWILIPSMIPALYRHRAELLLHTKAIISGGDLLEPVWAQQILEGTQVQLYSLYGTSQTGVCSIANTEDLRQYPGTLGKPLKGINARLEQYEPGSPDELCIRCAWSAGEERKKHIATGDLVRINEQGYWFFRGRKDGMQVVGGLNIYPEAMEEQLRKYAGIRSVKVRVHKDTNLQSNIHTTISVDPAFDEQLFERALKDLFPEHRIRLHIFPVSADEYKGT